MFGTDLTASHHLHQDIKMSEQINKTKKKSYFDKFKNKYYQNLESHHIYRNDKRSTKSSIIEKDRFPNISTCKSTALKHKHKDITSSIIIETSKRKEQNKHQESQKESNRVNNPSKVCLPKIDANSSCVTQTSSR